MQQHRRFTIIAVTVLSIWLAHHASAQRIQLKASRGPYYAGEPLEFQVVVTGFERSPQPECGLGDLPPGLHATLLGVSPRVAESIVQVNGRITRKTMVTHQFDYQIVADQPGTYELGPFTVTQGERQVSAKSESLEFRSIANDPEMFVALVLPTGPVYEGQHVPVRVEWGYAGDLGQVNGLTIRSELFDKFEFEDTPLRRGEYALPIQTAQGSVQLRAQYVQREIQGRKYTVVVAQRTLLAEQPGTYDLAPVTASMRKGGSRSSDIFDDFFSDSIFGRSRTRNPSVPVRAAGKPQSLTILPLPLPGRPASFSGAVGQGFHVDVQANRTVVRVGDPISLRITIRGDGNLQQVGLPDLSDDGGLSTSQFRLPTEEVAGTFQDGAKQFAISVRVNEETVNEIPPIAFSWFDPLQGAYRTARSQPISMRVMPAQVVSSSDVVSNAPADATPAADSDSEVTNDQSQAVNSPATAADFAVETDVTRLVSRGNGILDSSVATASLYVMGLAVLGLAVLDNRRRQLDPGVARRRHTLATQKSRIRAAATTPAAEAAEQVAAALRKVLPESTTEQRREIESLVADLEHLIYAPGGQDAQRLEEDMIRRALQLIDAVQEAAA